MITANYFFDCFTVHCIFNLNCILLVINRVSDQFFSLYTKLLPHDTPMPFYSRFWNYCGTFKALGLRFDWTLPGWPVFSLLFLTSEIESTYRVGRGESSIHIVFQKSSQIFKKSVCFLSRSVWSSHVGSHTSYVNFKLAKYATFGMVY